MKIVVICSLAAATVKRSIFDDTAMVMVNGRLFNAADLSEIGGKQRPAPEFFWQRGGAGVPAGVHYGPTVPCHCPKSDPHGH